MLQFVSLRRLPAASAQPFMDRLACNQIVGLRRSRPHCAGAEMPFRFSITIPWEITNRWLRPVTAKNVAPDAMLEHAYFLDGYKSLAKKSSGRSRSDSRWRADRLQCSARMRRSTHPDSVSNVQRDAAGRCITVDQNVIRAGGRRIDRDRLRRGVAIRLLVIR